MNDVKNERVAQALESIRDMKYIPKELEAAIKEAKPPRYVKTQGPDVTDKKVDTLLTDLYYKKGYTLGRGNLWLLCKRFEVSSAGSNQNFGPCEAWVLFA